MVDSTGEKRGAFSAMSISMPVVVEVATPASTNTATMPKTPARKRMRSEGRCARAASSGSSTSRCGASSSGSCSGRGAGACVPSVTAPGAGSAAGGRLGTAAGAPVEGPACSGLLIVRSLIRETAGDGAAAGCPPRPAGMLSEDSSEPSSTPTSAVPVIWSCPRITTHRPEDGGMPRRPALDRGRIGRGGSFARAPPSGRMRKNAAGDGRPRRGRPR